MTSLGRELVLTLTTVLREDEQLRDELRALLVGDLGSQTECSPWLSLREAAAYLGVSERTVQRMQARGRIRSTTIGRRRLYDRRELDKYATAREEVAPTTPPRRRNGVD